VLRWTHGFVRKKSECLCFPKGAVLTLEYLDALRKKANEIHLPPVEGYLLRADGKLVFIPKSGIASLYMRCEPIKFNKNENVVEPDSIGDVSDQDNKSKI